MNGCMSWPCRCHLKDAGTEPRKITEHLREASRHDMTLATHTDKLELTRDGGFPAGTRVFIFFGERDK